MKMCFKSALVCLGIAIGYAAPVEPNSLKAVFNQAAVCQPGDNQEPFRRIEESLQQVLGKPSLRAELELGLIRLLQSDATFGARKFACQQLGIIGSQRALPALSDLLADEATAGIACLALSTYPPGAADETLREALPHSSGLARAQIATALGDRHDSRAVKLLAGLARDGDDACALAAIAALGKIPTAAAWKAILALKRTESAELKAAVTEAQLRQAENFKQEGKAKLAMRIYNGLSTPTQPAFVRRGALASALALERDKGERRIRQILQSGDPVLTPVAIASIRGLTSPNTSKVFAQFLPTAAAQTKVWLIDSLAARADADALGAISGQLDDTDTEVRRAAILALGSIGNCSTVPVLVGRLARSSDTEERRSIEGALAGLPGLAASTAAVDAELKKASGLTRAHLVAVTARRRGAEANPVFFSEAAGSDIPAAKAAFRALAVTAHESEVPRLLELLMETAHDSGVRAEAEAAAGKSLLRIQPASERSKLVCTKLEKAQDEAARAAFIGLLPICGDDRALEAAQAALKTGGSASSRDAGLNALADWPNFAAWQPLMDFYRLSNASEIVARGVALRGLTRLAGEENSRATEALVMHYRELLMAARSDGELKLILASLAGLSRPEAVELIAPMLANGAVKLEAEVALKKVAEGIKAKYPEAAKAALSKL